MNTVNNFKINRYRQFLLADSGYCSNNNKSFLKTKGYTPIIAYNKGNCRNQNTINKNTLKGKSLDIYKKRNTIEAFFSWIKNFPVINQNYQKTISSYNGLFLLASCIIISNRV